MQSKMYWRAAAVVFCALVFFFALHAKTAVYSSAPSAKVTASTASKLWVSSSQKMEVPPVDSASGLLFWMAVLCFFAVYLVRAPHVQRGFVIPSARHLPLWQLHRFLRPPPVQA